MTKEPEVCRGRDGRRIDDLAGNADSSIEIFRVFAGKRFGRAFEVLESGEDAGATGEEVGNSVAKFLKSLALKIGITRRGSSCGTGEQREQATNKFVVATRDRHGRSCGHNVSSSSKRPSLRSRRSRRMVRK